MFLLNDHVAEYLFFFFLVFINKFLAKFVELIVTNLDNILVHSVEYNDDCIKMNIVGITICGDLNSVKTLILDLFEFTFITNRRHSCEFTLNAKCGKDTS